METLVKSPIRLEREGDIAFVVLDNPPTNTLGPRVRSALNKTLDHVFSDPGIRVVILCGSGAVFSSGLELRELEGTEMRTDPEPSLADICARIDRASKPVVAALHGDVLSGGFELALAAHYRVAAPRTRIGMGDIKLGLIPSAGATQRLPRLVGADAALNILLSGEQITSKQAYDMGFVDRVDELAVAHDLHAASDVRITALDFASYGLEARPSSGRAKHLKDVDAFTAAVSAHQMKVDDSYHRSVAAEAIVRCVEAAMLLPFAAGLEMERDEHEILVQSAEARSLRYVRFAREAAGTIRHADEFDGVQIQRLGIFGDGQAGLALACDIITSGQWVSLVVPGTGAAHVALDDIGEHLKTRIKAGHLTDRQSARALNLLSLSGSVKDLHGCDMVMEAMPNSHKATTLGQLNRLLGADCILASDMRGDLAFDDLEQASGRTERFVGLRSGLTIHGSRLVEIVVGSDTSAETIAASHGFLNTIGKTPICTRFLVSQRLETKLRACALRLVMMGATPGQIDASMRLFGFRYGPFQMADLQGIDALIAGSSNPDPLFLQMAERDWLGRRAGFGFYRYGDGPLPLGANRDLAKLLASARGKSGLTQRRFDDGAIRDRLIMSLINEASAIVAAEVVMRPSDIDVIAIEGFGYPQHRGGILMEADRAGLFGVVRNIDKFAKEDPEFWSAHPMLREMARQRRSFIDLAKI